MPQNRISYNKPNFKVKLNKQFINVSLLHSVSSCCIIIETTNIYKNTLKNYFYSRSCTLKLNIGNSNFLAIFELVLKIEYS